MKFTLNKNKIIPQTIGFGLVGFSITTQNLFLGFIGCVLLTVEIKLNEV